MGFPLMIPKSLITLIIRNPVSLHIIQYAGLSRIRQKFRDISVVTRRVAVFTVSAIAVVRPETVDCPGCAGAGTWAGVPELDLLK
jgi:hypothetical protein